MQWILWGSSKTGRYVAFQTVYLLKLTDFRTHPIGVTLLRTSTVVCRLVNVWLYYCLETKLQERNVYNSVSHSVHRGIMHADEGSFNREFPPPPPRPTDRQSMGGHVIYIVLTYRRKSVLRIRIVGDFSWKIYFNHLSPMRKFTIRRKIFTW